MRRPRPSSLRFAVVLLTGFVLVPAAAAQELPTPEEILRRYAEVTGGSADAPPPPPTRMVVRAEMGETVMTTETLMAPPDRVLTRMTVAAGLTMTIGFDGETAWMDDPIQGSRVLTEAQAHPFRQMSETPLPTTFAEQASSMETIGIDTVAGIPCYSVRYHIETVPEVVSCYSIETGLAVGSTVTPRLDCDPASVEVVYENYERMNGVLMPTRMRNRLPGGLESVVTVLSIDSVPIDPSVFSPPPGLRREP